MICGAGNELPTPKIVLDILGADPEYDPEPMSYEALGEGNKQHNMAKVYSGLYEILGHVVPYICVVKVGKPSEVVSCLHEIWLILGKTRESWKTRLSIDFDEIFESGSLQWGNVSFGTRFIQSYSNSNRHPTELL